MGKGFSTEARHPATGKRSFPKEVQEALPPAGVWGRAPEAQPLFSKAGNGNKDRSVDFIREHRFFG